MVGVTNQTANVRSIINPLIQAGCLAPIEDDKSKLRNIRFGATTRGLEYLRNIQSKTQTVAPDNDLGDNLEPLLFPEFK